MSSSQDIIRLQAKKHVLVPIEDFRTIEEYCLFLIHLKAYEEAAKMAKDKSVLDYGCNIGYGTKVIGTNCKEVIGVDVSPKAIEEARRRFGSNGIEFRLSDGIRLPFKDNRFDLVVSFQVIEHIDDYDSYLTEIKRVLADTGKVLFTTPNARIRLDPGMKPLYPFHVREFSAGELQKLLQRYFPQVAIRGLFGKEPLYSTELNRVKTALLKYRRRPQWVNTLSHKSRAVLPASVIGHIKTMLSSLKGKKKLDPAILQLYSTDDLFYRDDNLDEALDLMAICHQSNAL